MANNNWSSIRSSQQATRTFNNASQNARQAYQQTLANAQRAHRNSAHWTGRRQARPFRLVAFLFKLILLAIVLAVAAPIAVELYGHIHQLSLK